MPPLRRRGRRAPGVLPRVRPAPARTGAPRPAPDRRPEPPPARRRARLRRRCRRAASRSRPSTTGTGRSRSSRATGGSVTTPTARDAPASLAWPRSATRLDDRPRVRPEAEGTRRGRRGRAAGTASAGLRTVGVLDSSQLREPPPRLLDDVLRALRERGGGDRLPARARVAVKGARVQRIEPLIDAPSSSVLRLPKTTIVTEFVTRAGTG